MDALQVAKLKFSPFQSCFIHIPREWVNHACYNNEVVVYKICSAQTKCDIFVSWSRKTTYDNTIEINCDFAAEYGFYDGEEVAVERQEDVHEAEEVKVTTSNYSDYEKLAKCTTSLENGLMRKVRIVWSGMKLPVWASSLSPVFVHIESVVPLCTPVVLVKYTRVVIDQGTSLEAGASDQASGSSGPVAAVGESWLSQIINHIPLLSRPATRSPSATSQWYDSMPAEQCAEEVLSCYRSICFTARVIPRKFCSVELCADHGSIEELLHDHPTTVFVSRSRIPAGVLGSDDLQVVTFIASIAKIASPQEKFDKARSDSKGESSATKKQRTEEALPDCETCFVRVFVVPTAWLDFHLLHGTDLVLVSDTLRRQLGLDYASKVELRSHSTSEQSVALGSITLYPIGRTKFTKHSISSAFRSWCDCISSCGYPLVLSSGGLLRLKHDSGEQRDFIVKLSQKRGDNGGAGNSHRDGEGVLNYCFLKASSNVDICLGKDAKPQPSKKCAKELPISNISLLDPDLQAPRLDKLGGVKDLCEKGLAWLKLLTAAQLLAARVCGQQQLMGDVLLITGQRGSGKSTLAKSLALHLLDSPPFAHVQVIQCSSLRGKRAEKIGKMWEDAVLECCFREPAVLVFDDLDTLAGAVAGPEQEKSPDALYFNKVADAFFKTLVALRELCSRVAVIVTGRSRESFNARLTASHGQHIFYTVLAIPPPNKAEREEILRCLVKMRPDLNEGGFDYSRVAHCTEGCYAQDLVTILDRAIHSFCTDASGSSVVMAAVPDFGNKITLLDEHFECALEEYCPASLRGLDLRSEHTLHWEDAGGLSDVKQTLQEVFLWPTKYPELFANSPIRPLSGLLLYGAPGTGKTLLAGIVASECAVNFISIKGPELLSKYIGASEQAIRNVFQRAHSAKPCIIFFDEFDSIAPRRGHDSTGVTDRVVNQLLTLLDGVETSTGVYVLAATSRPDLIDPALLRPGRLDKCLHCPLPNTEERANILVALSRKLMLADDVDLKSAAARTEHFSGADLQALLYTAQLEVVHEVFPEDEPKGDSPGRRFDCSWSSDDTPGLGETEFFCAPSAIRGPAESTPDQTRQLQLEVGALSENLLGQGPRRQQRRRSRRDSTALALSIHQRHLEQALAKTSASVSAAERSKFDTIYSLFRSGSSLAELRMAAGQRVTLA